MSNDYRALTELPTSNVLTRSQREAAARRVEEMSQDVPLCPNAATDGSPILPAEADDGLTAPQRVAIAALISGKTFAMAARVAEVDRRTLFRWRQNEAFRRALDQITREALDATATRVRNLMLRATRVLSEGMVGNGAFGCTMRVANSARLWGALAAAERRLDEAAGEALND